MSERDLHLPKMAGAFGYFRMTFTNFLQPRLSQQQRIKMSFAAVVVLVAAALCLATETASADVVGRTIEWWLYDSTDQSCSGVLTGVSVLGPIVFSQFHPFDCFHLATAVAVVSSCCCCVCVLFSNLALLSCYIPERSSHPTPPHLFF